MAFDPRRVQALLFDVDGTLSDTDDLYTQALTGLLGAWQPLLGRRDPNQLARQIVLALETPGNAGYALLDRLGLDGPLLALIQRGRGIFSRHKAQRFLLIPGVEAMLGRLHGRYPLAVVSARGRHGTQAFLEQFGLAHYFQTVTTAQTTFRTKPHPQPVLHTARLLGMPAAACLMIGDTSVDMHAGKAAGAQTVGVLCGFGAADELVRAGADRLLLSTAELADLLE